LVQGNPAIREIWRFPSLDTTATSYSLTACGSVTRYLPYIQQSIVLSLLCNLFTNQLATFSTHAFTMNSLSPGT